MILIYLDLYNDIFRYEKFWPAVEKDSPQTAAPSVEATFSVQILRGARFSLLNQQALSPGRVIQNIALTKEEACVFVPFNKTSIDVDF